MTEESLNYNEELVYYCKHCLSLKIKGVGEDKDLLYCDECNSANIEKTDIYTWLKLYEDKYKKSYINYGKDK